MFHELYHPLSKATTDNPLKQSLKYIDQIERITPSRTSLRGDDWTLFNGTFFNMSVIVIWSPESSHNSLSSQIWLSFDTKYEFDRSYKCKNGIQGKEKMVISLRFWFNYCKISAFILLGYKTDMLMTIIAEKGIWPVVI